MTKLEEELPMMRTGAPEARLNFQIPGDIHKGLKIAATIGDTTIRMMVITILDQWLNENDITFDYEPVEFG